MTRIFLDNYVHKFITMPLRLCFGLLCKWETGYRLTSSSSSRFRWPSSRGQDQPREKGPARRVCVLVVAENRRRRWQNLCCKVVCMTNEHPADSVTRTHDAHPWKESESERGLLWAFKYAYLVFRIMCKLIRVPSLVRMSPGGGWGGWECIQMDISGLMRWAKVFSESFVRWKWIMFWRIVDQYTFEFFLLSRFWLCSIVKVKY